MKNEKEVLYVIFFQKNIYVYRKNNTLKESHLLIRRIYCLCGSPAKRWAGHVIAKDKMALGNYIDIKVTAGFCDKHKEIMGSAIDGNYGYYNSPLMGKCIPLFEKKG